MAMEPGGRTGGERGGGEPERSDGVERKVDFVFLLRGVKLVSRRVLPHIAIVSLISTGKCL